ncbi:MAG: DEAD/DEAH box helicase family protein [Lentisphaerae bacterium]|jgi:very-short-patch-repair endonuclease|nr:DEAD/DEAH box helicase family protein [Lentisphaerota bacterium]
MESNFIVTHDSPASDKIDLFRSLFRGRTDVYPRRFESRKTGRSGFSPACANEWVRGLCDKRKVKCANCPNRQLLPVTDQVIRRHLTGVDDNGREFVAGIYPMLLDETCFFLAMDFDKEHWATDIGEVLLTCREIGLPVAAERSRSGNGAHLWLFFEEAIPAVLARKLGAHLLTETMERRPDIGLDSYDRLFPNQDTLPKGGFGNLIALPLQKRARESGNSAFIDEHLKPFSDQWKFLSSIRKIAKSQVEAIVREAEAQGRIMGVQFVLGEEEHDTPWTLPASRVRREPSITGPLPAVLDLVLGNEIYISKSDLVPALRNRLLRLAAFQNPEFYRAQAMRLPMFDKPRIIACAEDHGAHIGLPRGCLDEIKSLLASLGIECRLTDQRYSGVPLDATFQGALRPEQVLAAKALASADTGVLAATTAFGKTVIAAWLIAQRKVNTLVLVHRQQLLEQWVERLAAFLDIPAKDIGRIGGGRKKSTGRVDVALIQSLVRKGVVKDLLGEYGHLVVDECHHLPAVSFEQVARRAKAKYVLGLSATVARKDGHHPIVFMHCGPVRYRVSAKQQAADRPFTHTVLVRPTSFISTDAAAQDMRMQFHNLYDALIQDSRRNQMLCDDIEAALREGRKPIVLTERREHLDILADLLAPRVQHLIVLQGGMGKRHLREALDRLAAIPENEDRVLLATGRFLGEGFDDARLDTLFLTLPISWRGTIAQYVGRLHRQHDLKREVRVVDYADLNVSMLAKMFDRRCRGYEATGYTILHPATTAPDWQPADAPNRLLQQLESLTETCGRFRLNAKLPIPFSNSDTMNVDLLCADARLVIELDASQHLNDPDTYRRDRQKDALLQENGYFVLRFLVEDIDKQLNRVLDAILRGLARKKAEERT